MEVTTVDRRASSRSTDVDQALVLLRTAVSECGYTLDALEVVMSKGRAYIHRVLQGDKPLTLEFITALPDDVEALFEKKRAEHFGLIVVEPVEGEVALKHFVGGLLGILAPRLPARAERMAHADLPATKKAVGE
jgi:hypothetical protein